LRHVQQNRASARGKELTPLKTKLNVISGLFNRAAVGVGIHPGQTGNILSGAQLQKGFTAQVRNGGPAGPVVATLQPGYGTNIYKAPFMCLGGAYHKPALGAAAGPIAKLSFYLEPR